MGALRQGLGRSWASPEARFSGALRRRAWASLVGITVAVAVGWTSSQQPVGASALAGCGQFDDRIEVTADTHLDPNCRYAGIDVTGSDLVLDCRGALVGGELDEPGAAILVTTPVGEPQRSVTIRNCSTTGHTNGIRVTREGFRGLAAGAEYDDAGHDITIEDSRVRDSRGVGIFVDGYVRGVTIRGADVEGAGSSGVYLEAGSVDVAILDSRIVRNGFTENGPGGSLFDLGGTTFRFWGPGREGISIDGSRRATLRGNHLEGNSAGGVFLYENCGEHFEERPERWFERRHGADDAVIEHNTIVGGRTGVWIASRQSENVLPMGCSDEPYVDEPGEVRTLDHAARATVRANTFVGVRYGVRVEDDGATVEANTFRSDDPTHLAVHVGAGPRTDMLGRPVEGLRLTGNRAEITGNRAPYRWAHGHDSTVEADNRADGEPSPLCEGLSIPMAQFLFVDALAVQPPEQPPVPRPPGGTADLDVLPPCDREAPPPADPGGPSTPTRPGRPTPSAAAIATVARFTG